MKPMSILQGRFPLLAASAIALGLVQTGICPAACCYFSAKNADILQPAQKVFITYDPSEKIETFTVQPKFEGNALDFGMVIPTPAQPKLHEMPRDFFKELAVVTILKQRKYPESRLLPQPAFTVYFGNLNGTAPAGGPASKPRPTTVKVLEAGNVG